MCRVKWLCLWVHWESSSEHQTQPVHAVRQICPAPSSFSRMCNVSANVLPPFCLTHVLRVRRKQKIAHSGAVISTVLLAVSRLPITATTICLNASHVAWCEGVSSS